ncbi:MAG: hypothetical protein PHU25_15165 [Deltaproteobacteria bacterium]|nr:hypothetical protein [Deltaproteobacteria bacterium]
MTKRVDLDAVRTARCNLKRIAEEHPELLGPASVNGWIEILTEVEEADMGKTVQVGVRFPPKVVAAIDRFAAEETVKLRQTLPGMELSRADAIRVLTMAALQARGYEVGGSSEPTEGATTGKPRRRKSK